MHFEVSKIMKGLEGVIEKDVFLRERGKVGELIAINYSKKGEVHVQESFALFEGI